MRVYMFHYVMKEFNYFHFESDMFNECISKIKNEYSIIGLEAAKYINENDGNHVMLTFDDGTKDHYEFVYPILKKYKVKGVFFLNSNIFENKILDIHLIHQLIAEVGAEKLYNDIQKLVKKEKIDIDKLKLINNTMDDYKMRYVKQLLQFALPNDMRNNFLEELILKYNISKDLKDYYLTKNEILEMKSNGMDFGLHTSNHKRLDLLSKEEQANEIIQNLNILKSNNILPNIKAIAYPFGSYNQETLEILKHLKINLGFTINKKLGCDNLLEIERIDCNVLKSERNN